MIRTLSCLLSIALATLAIADTEQASPQRFDELIHSENTVLVDLRTPAETAEAKIPGAIEIDFFDKQIASKLGSLPKDKTLLLYCRSGNRSGQAAKLLEDQGYENLVNLVGGIKAWQAAELPIESASESD